MQQVCPLHQPYLAYVCMFHLKEKKMTSNVGIAEPKAKIKNAVEVVTMKTGLVMCNKVNPIPTPLF